MFLRLTSLSKQSQRNNAQQKLIYYYGMNWMFHPSRCCATSKSVIMDRVILSQPLCAFHIPVTFESAFIVICIMQLLFPHCFASQGHGIKNNAFIVKLWNDNVLLFPIMMICELSKPYDISSVISPLKAASWKQRCFDNTWYQCCVSFN